MHYTIKHILVDSWSLKDYYNDCLILPKLSTDRECCRLAVEFCRNLLFLSYRCVTFNEYIWMYFNLSLQSALHYGCV